MKNYELALIIKEDEKKTADSFNRIKELLTSKNIKINKEDTWGSRKMAYPIKNETSGYYVILYITGDYQNINIVEKSLLIDDNLLRYRLFKDEPKTDSKINKKPRRKK
ncbi:MAG: 30S ribosomal protein S6 [Spirochaetes bacterium]|nr:30S ribosomal protein S6 [Spirochaetota bacterium]